MAAQHLPRDLVQPRSGCKNWIKRRSSQIELIQFKSFFGISVIAENTQRKGTLVHGEMIRIA